MARIFDAVKKIFGGNSDRPKKREPKRRDPQFVGRSSVKEIEQAPPERVGELAGHAVERVDT